MLYVAGNDEIIAIRALLLIAVVDAVAANKAMQRSVNSLLSVFEEIAIALVPMSDLQTELKKYRQIEENRAIRRREQNTARKLKGR